MRQYMVVRTFYTHHVQVYGSKGVTKSKYLTPFNRGNFKTTFSQCSLGLQNIRVQNNNRKYKDYVYRKMLVQEYLKKWRIFKRVKPKNDMMYHDIYNCICQNTKKIRFIIHYVKPTAQLLFRIRFPKGGPTCRRQVVNPLHQTSQGQSVAKPETPLQNIQVE